jgi:hypothetical protein
MAKIEYGKPIKLAVDTSNVNTFLDNEIANALGLKLKPIIGWRW